MYAKSELANAYLPHLEPRSATNRLMAWIKHNEALMQALVQTGYYPTQKYFSPLQVSLVVDVLGEP